MFERREIHRNKSEQNVDAFSDAVFERYIYSEDLRDALQEVCAISESDARNTLYAMANIIYQMRDHIEQYDVVVGDDVSARLVTRFMRTAINDARQEHDMSRVETFFIAGGKVGDSLRSKTQRDIQKWAEAYRDKKVLFVTEYIFGGEKIVPIIDDFEASHIAFDVVTLSSRFMPGFVDNNGAILDRSGVPYSAHNHQARFYKGAFGDIGLAFYGLRVNGVEKVVDKNTYCVAREGVFQEYGTSRVVPNGASHDELESARAVMDVCAQKIVRAIGAHSDER